MKGLFTTLLLIQIFAITACDAPRDRRASLRLTDPNSSSIVNNNGGYDYSGRDSETTSSGGNNSGSTSTDTSTSTIPDEIKHCNWSMNGVTGHESVHNHLGEHTICQSKTNRADIYIQTKSPINDAQVCLIPTSNNGNKSVYIGEPRCLMLSDPMRIYKVTLLRNRSGFSNYTVTGVMVMKDKAFFYPAPFYQNLLSPDAYLFCSQYLDMYGNDSYCRSFQSVGQYIYKEFY
jgi:hypothetical protein